MKILASAAVLALIAVPAFAQQTASTSTAAPAPAAGTGAAATTATATALTIDSPIETIVANPAGKAVLDEVIPGMTSHPAFDQFKSMTVKQLQPLAQGLITDEMVTKITEGLAKIK